MPRQLTIATIALAGALVFMAGVVAALVLLGDDDGPSAESSRGSVKATLGVTVTVAANQGLRVAAVDPGGPAADAGIAAGDLIRSVDGRVVRTPEQLRSEIESRSPGDEVRITYERGDRELQARARLGVAPASVLVEATPQPGAGPRNLPRPQLGIQAQNITPELRQRFNLNRSSGVVVTSVTRNGPAGQAGVLTADIILSADGATIDTVEQLQRAVDAAGDEISLTVLRGTQEITIDVTLTQSPFSNLEDLPPRVRERIRELVESGALSPDQLQRLVQGYQNNLAIGTVKAISSDSITVASLDGGPDVTYALNALTEYRRGVSRAGPADVAIGSTVLVISVDGRTATGVLIYSR